MYTNQQIMDRVRDVFVTKGAKQSRAWADGCMYSHEGNGYGCAIGCLIPPDVADKWDAYDWPAIGTICNKDPVFPTLFSPDSLPMLTKLQIAHDNWDSGCSTTFTEHMDRETRAIAKQFGLEAR